MVVLAALAACLSGPEAMRGPEHAVSRLDVYPGLEATLFASEPELTNPTNIDVDHRGRVWACDVVNYREHARNDLRPEGDRILILEDTDGDGVSDRTKVYYQGRDVDAALGIAVLGNRVVVTAAPNVIVFVDEDGDDKPDRKEYLFTRSGKPQDDHSTHSLSFGPDGNFYWNMGNAGRYIHDKDGRLVIDEAGHPVLDRNYERALRANPGAARPDFADGLVGRSSPYQGGMVFRSGADGGRTEVLGHNFRNNYEVAVDSLGGLWQSDNDNDGSYACRLNYILEYGNYGYRDELSGAGNQARRTGRSDVVPHRHWHQNDPGVVPNLLITGAGSPTGVAVYEGSLLPAELRDQVLATDAGPGVLRGIVTEKVGAGYSARMVDILKGERDKWVRPVDVAVAPDGSLFVSDWYDPVIGWNRQQETGRGRIFRIAPLDSVYSPEPPTLETVDGAIDALKSPNSSVRYMAWQSLDAGGTEAEASLVRLFREDDRIRHRARALWLLSRFAERREDYLEEAFRDPEEDIRIVGIRAARQLDLDLAPILVRLASDPSPHVRREVAIALRNVQSEHAIATWGRLADRHEAGDRWYLEALGIAADGRWDALLGPWLAAAPRRWSTPAGMDILWRSRASVTPAHLARILSSPDLPEAEAARYLRAFDFLPDSESKSRSLRQLALGRSREGMSQPFFVASEALLRLPRIELGSQPGARGALDQLLERGEGTEQFALLVQRYGLSDHYPALVRVAALNSDNPIGIASARTLLEDGAADTILGFIRENSELAPAAVKAVGNVRSSEAAPVLEAVLLDPTQPAAVQERAVRSLAGFSQGAEALVEIARRGEFPAEFAEVAGAAITRSMHVRLRDEAAALFPVPPMKASEPLPQMTELLVYVGNPDNGAAVFESATCSDCHVVDGAGTEFGPDLSEIGDKLSKAGLYESILDPSASVSPDFDLVHLSLADRDEASGFVISETAGAVTLRMEGGIVADFSLGEILLRRKSTVSAMPDDLQEQMSVDDLVDLVEYLSRLR